MKKSPIQDGTWVQEQDDRYCVTGVDKMGKRFCMTYPSWSYARSINIWKGSRWLIRDGKKYLIERVYN